MVKIVESEVDFRVLQSNDRTKHAMRLISITAVPTGLPSVKTSAQSVSFPLEHRQRDEDETKMPHHNPKSPPGFSKIHEEIKDVFLPPEGLCTLIPSNK